jgi:putative component of toxin-antitoxin plasmid stabilization module
MYQVKPLPEFNAWLDGIQDRLTQRRLATRLRKATLGSLGDVKPVGDGVFEMLGGGDKSTQQADIAAAIALSKNL